MSAVRFGVAVVAVSFVVACGGTMPPPADAGVELPTFQPDPIAWAPCSDAPDWECGTLVVPRDYAVRDVMLKIAVNRHKATDPARRIGVLFYNPGGPGPGLAETRGYADSSPSLTERFDFIGFDRRGTGKSEPSLHCLDTAQIEAGNHIDGARDLAEARAFTDTLRQACLTLAGTEGLAAVGTEDVARDLDTLRIALGEEKLNYVGASYGTMLGAQYATLFPTHVRAFVLDAPSAPQMTPTFFKAQLASVEARLAEFFRYCAEYKCGLAPDGNIATAKAAWANLLVKIDAGRVAGGRRAITANDLYQTVVLYLYLGEDEYYSLGVLLTVAQTQLKGTDILAQVDANQGRQADGSFATFGDDSTIAIECLDGLASWTEESFAADLEAVRAFSPRLGVAALASYSACIHWPVPVKPLHVDATKAPPMLVLIGTADPATPTDEGLKLIAQLNPASPVVTYQKSGHAFSSREGMQFRVEAFLTSPETVGASKTECSTWPRKSATTAPTTFTIKSYNNVAITYELLNGDTNAVIQSGALDRIPAFNDFHVTVPAGTAAHYALLDVFVPGTQKDRIVLDLRRPQTGFYFQYAFAASTVTQGAADVGIVHDPAKGEMTVRLLDCDGQSLVGAHAVIDTGDLIYGCPSNTLDTAITSCGAFRLYNVTPGLHTLGIEYKGQSFPGGSVNIEGGVTTSMTITPAG